MSVWLFRAGSGGEYESKFLSDNRVYLTWDHLNVDLATLTDKAALLDYLNANYSTGKPARNRNWVGQIWPIAHDIAKDDLIVLPSKMKSSVHIGRASGIYIFEPGATDPFLHHMDVDWFAKDIPRSNFDQDLLYSFGAFMTVCRISRNDAEKRIRQMAKSNWQSTISLNAVTKLNPGTGTGTSPIDDSEDGNIAVDLEQYSIDGIAKLLIRKFKGHGMTRVVDAILRANGYTTYLSPEGPDKGVDILAAPGNLGFERPRICVQVKSQESALERTILDQLIGAMQRFSAEQGLLVAWGGFKSTYADEKPMQFFKVRMWDQNDLIRELLNVYDKLDEELKAEIPLKRIWTLSISEEGSDI